MYIINPIAEQTVLDKVYPKAQIFIERAEFSESEPSVTVTCFIQPSDFYTTKPIPYVTTENYVRCLSQASYLLAEYVLENKLIDVETDIEIFRKAAADYELYYRNIAMTFHERVGKGQKFILRLSIKNAREIKRLGNDFILFTFSNEKTVISGEMSFVFINH